LCDGSRTCAWFRDEIHGKKIPYGGHVLQYSCFTTLWREIHSFTTLAYKYIYKDTWVKGASYFYDKLAYLLRKILHPYFYDIGI
jgi:hypothetical protein